MPEPTPTAPNKEPKKTPLLVTPPSNFQVIGTYLSFHLDHKDSPVFRFICEKSKIIVQNYKNGKFENFTSKIDAIFYSYERKAKRHIHFSNDIAETISLSNTRLQTTVFSEKTGNWKEPVSYDGDNKPGSILEILNSLTPNEIELLNLNPEPITASSPEVKVSNTGTATTPQTTTTTITNDTSTVTTAPTLTTTTAPTSTTTIVTNDTSTTTTAPTSTTTIVTNDTSTTTTAPISTTTIVTNDTSTTTTAPISTTTTVLSDTGTATTPQTATTTITNDTSNDTSIVTTAPTSTTTTVMGDPSTATNTPLPALGANNVNVTPTAALTTAATTVDLATTQTPQDKKILSTAAIAVAPTDKITDSKIEENRTDITTATNTSGVTTSGVATVTGIELVNGANNTNSDATVTLNVNSTATTSQTGQVTGEQSVISPDPTLPTFIPGPTGSPQPTSKDIFTPGETSPKPEPEPKSPKPKDPNEKTQKANAKKATLKIISDEIFVTEVKDLINAITLVTTEIGAAVSEDFKQSITAIGKMKTDLNKYLADFRAKVPLYTEIDKELYTKIYQKFRSSCRDVLFANQNDMTAAPAIFNRIKAFVSKILEKYFGSKGWNIEKSAFTKSQSATNNVGKVHSLFFKARDFDSEMKHQKKDPIVSDSSIMTCK